MEEKIVQLKLDCHQCNNLEKLPQMKTLTIVNERYEEIYPIEIALSMEPFFNHLLTLPPIRILLWGKMGTGKSSFINGVYSILCPDENFPGAIRMFAIARPAQISVTLNYTRYEPGVQDPCVMQPLSPKCNVSICDTWGWEENSPCYPPILYPYLFNGSLPSGFKMEAAKNFSPDAFKANPKKAISVAFVAMTVQSADSTKYIDAIDKSIFKELKSRGVPFVILLMQVDQVVPEFRADPLGSAAAPKVKAMINEVATKIQIDPQNIVPIVNYTEEKERTFNIDKAFYVALRKGFLMSKVV
jgi:GTP-binding protein EngB required for normal cell division